VTQAEALLKGVDTQAVVAERAYDAQILIDTLTECGAQAVIPPGVNRTQMRAFDRHLYKGRNLVERFFCRIKHLRRIATPMTSSAGALRCSSPSPRPGSGWPDVNTT